MQPSGRSHWLLPPCLEQFIYFFHLLYSVVQKDKKSGPLKLTNPILFNEPCGTIIGGVIKILLDCMVT